MLGTQLHPFKGGKSDTITIYLLLKNHTSLLKMHRRQICKEYSDEACGITQSCPRATELM